MFDFNADLEALNAQLPQDALDAYEAFEDQTNYQDAAGPTPPATGNYELKLEKFGWRKKKDSTELILTDGKFPILGIQSATIVGETQFEGAGENVGGGLGAGKERKIGLLFDVRTKPFERQGGAVASSFIDLLRSFDVSQANIRHLVDEGFPRLVDFYNQGKTFRVRLDWTAEDYQARNKALAAYGDTTAEQKARLTKEQFNAIYDRFRVKSMRQFQKRPGGGYDPIWISPAGTPVEARLAIVKFYPSTDTVRLGPDNTH
jgi:hypothetical protein